MEHKVAIHWFRKGLRLHDNPALCSALERAAVVLPLFVIDPWFASSKKVGVRRYKFLLESLQDLDDSLRKRDSQLFVARGKPDEVIPRLLQQWNASLLTYESDTEPYAKTRDAAISKLAKEAGVKVDHFCSHTLFDPEKLFALAGGKVGTTYDPFLKLCSRAGPIPQPLDAPTELNPPSEEILTATFSWNFTVPTLKEMGYAEVEPATPFVGGESNALARMRSNLSRKTFVLEFEKPKTAPTALSPSTTVLSPYLKFGCLSPRLFWHELDKVYGTNKHTKPPVSLDGQLMWREFYYFVGAHTANYDKMEGNPICRQIPWNTNPEYLKAWENAQTGFPWIDAAMTQLHTQGWIHHLARHAVACFLTRGDLWISWEEGAKVFDKLLLDADWSVNNGNWMWLSCSCFFYQYFRCYSPVAFAKKTDKSGVYIRHWLPKLRKFPDKYIYEPWSAPASIQKQAGCIIGKDYPAPLVDHTKISKENMGKMKAAYDAHKRQAATDKEAAKKNKKQKTKK